MKKLGIISVITALCSVIAAPAGAAEVPCPSVLNGTVAQVLSVGTAVREGDVLLTVQSLTGPMAAARSSVTGTVRSVSAAPGTQVQQGDVVIVVETK